jgi:acyl-CoA synthetase (AMP-forming)/AMP-acid ligase II/pimeloyl-ACP methyl ester carboxylesterase
MSTNPVTKMVVHHGSPGTPRDFSNLKNQLPKNIEVITYDRMTKIKSRDFDEAEIQLGYSFGCVEALRSAIRNKKTKLVILVAPYLFPQKKPGPVMKGLLLSDLFRNLALPVLAKSSIEKMLKESSHPQAIPEDYKTDAKEYLNSERLALAITEKDISADEISNHLQILSDSNTPVLVVMGEGDQTCYKGINKEQQFNPLLPFKNIDIKTILDGGHALLWTHPKELAKKIISAMEKYMGQAKETSGSRLGYFEGSDENNNVASFLREHKAKFPMRNILTWVNPQDIKNWNGDINTPLPHQSVKVAELDHLVAVLTTEFKNQGIAFGDRVILFLPMSLYMYASMFALQKMGAIPTFLDSWARRDQMGVSAKVAAPKAMISADRAFTYLADVPEIAQIPIKIVAGEVTSSIPYSAKLEMLLQGKTPSGISPVEKEHTALITFTTGSSGTPKGADRSHRFLAAQHYALNRHLPYAEGDKDLPVFPIFSLNNLAAGVETIIPAIDVGAPAPTDALVLYVQMKSAGVTCTTLSPSLFNALATFCIDKNLKLDFLKRVVTGGAPISRSDVARMKSVAKNAEILVLYGSTEVEPMAHIEAVEMLAETQDPDSEIVEAGVNVGALDSGLKYKFIHINKDAVYVTQKSDWKNLEVEAGSVGELIVAGEHVCEKYFNNEDAFFRAKIRDEKGVVWHRTGDLGKVDKHNNLWIVGRVHNAINRKGQYFFPVRAEIILKKFPFVDKAAFLGISDPTLNEKTYAVFSSQDKNLNIDQAKKEIKRVMEKNQFVVDEIMHVDSIPMDPRHHSKVEYEVLKKKIMGTT